MADFFTSIAVDYPTTTFTDVLNPFPVINGTARRPQWLYAGRQAKRTWPPFVGENSLSPTGSGKRIDRGRGYLRTYAGEYLTSTATNVWAIRTADYYWEACVRRPASDADLVVFSSGPDATHPFALLYWENSLHGYSNEWRVSGTVAIRSPLSLAENGQWDFLSGYGNRDEASTSGAGVILNGTQGTGVDVSAQAASLVPTTAMLVSGGAFASLGTVQTDIAWLGLWTGIGMIAAGATGAAEMLALHQARYALLEFPV